MHISVFINIENHLHRPQDKYLRDKDLQDTTLDALVQEPAFSAIRVYADRGPLPESGQWISISTQGYAVRLDGQVSSLYLRRLAEGDLLVGARQLRCIQSSTRATCRAGQRRRNIRCATSGTGKGSTAVCRNHQRHNPWEGGDPGELRARP